MNDRKHFPTEMGGVTSPTSASSQRAGTVLSALPAARNEPQGTSQHGPRADCRHPIPADRRTPRRQLGRNKAGCRSVGRGTALESQNAELCEVGQLLHLRCEQVAALSRKVKMPSPPRTRFANELDDFVAYMASEQGLSPISIRSHRMEDIEVPEWFANRHRLLSSATLDDVDEFLAFKANNGWNRESVSTAAQALRSFFRHAERRGWCKAGIAAGIQ